MRKLIAGLAVWCGALCLVQVAYAQDMDQDRSSSTPQTGVPVKNGVGPNPVSTNPSANGPQNSNGVQNGASQSGDRKPWQTGDAPNQTPAQSGATREQRTGGNPQGTPTAAPVPGQLSPGSEHQRGMTEAPASQLGHSTNSQSRKAPPGQAGATQMPASGTQDKSRANLADPQRDAERQKPTPPARRSAEIKGPGTQKLSDRPQSAGADTSTEKPSWLREKDGTAVHPDQSGQARDGSPFAGRGPHAKLDRDPVQKGTDSRQIGVAGPKVAKEEKHYGDEQLSPKRTANVGANSPKPDKLNYGDSHMSPRAQTGITVDNSPTRGSQYGTVGATPSNVGVPAPGHVGSGTEVGNGKPGGGRNPTPGVGTPTGTVAGTPGGVTPTPGTTAKPGAKPDAAKPAAAMPDPSSERGKPDPGTDSHAAPSEKSKPADSAASRPDMGGAKGTH